MMRKRRAANRSWRRRPPGRSERTVVLTNRRTTRPRRKLLSSGRAAQSRPPHQGRVRVGGGDALPPEVAQREPIARGFGRRALLQLLVQIPVQPLVAVEEPQDVAARAKRDVLRKPRECHGPAALPAGAVEDDLAEGAERLRHLEDYRAAVEVAQRREVRRGAVSKRFDDDLVVGPR